MPGEPGADMDAKAQLKEAKRLQKAGDHPAALDLAHDLLRNHPLAPDEMSRVGKLVAEIFAADPGQDAPLQVAVLGQCTTTWLLPLLTAVGWRHHGALEINEGEYDNVLQDVMELAAGDATPDVIVLVPWHQRLLGQADRAPAVRVEDEVLFWQQVWGTIAEQLGCRIVQVGYDWVTPGAHGAYLGGELGGDMHLVAETNQALRAALPADAYFVDLAAVSGLHGRAGFYDLRNYDWTKQPFSQTGLLALAEHLWAGIRAVCAGPKRVAVVDLDNTLWGGVVGEEGPLGVTLGEGPDGEAFVRFQTYLRNLSKRGILLAVASKNNPDDAREPFTSNPNMVLGLDDIASFVASWDPKDRMLDQIASELNLGKDTFVFIDDNPFECAQVRAACPEVETVLLPPDPADYVPAVESGLWFEAATLTAEDSERAASYAATRKREAARASGQSLDDYFASLGMLADIRPIDDADMPRVTQLVGKTNQFNLTTRRHSSDEIRRLLDTPGAIGRTLRLSDRFGDYGLVGVLLCVPENEGEMRGLRIDTWLMSCRVIGRTAEHKCFNELLTLAQTAGVTRIIGEYIPTKKNAKVADLYPALGFAAGSTDEDARVTYVLDVGEASPQTTFVESVG